MDVSSNYTHFCDIKLTLIICCYDDETDYTDPRYRAVASPPQKEHRRTLLEKQCPSYYYISVFNEYMAEYSGCVK